MRQWTAWLNWPSRDWGRGRAGADVSSQHGKPNFTAVAGIGAVGDAIDSIKLRRSTFLRHDLNANPGGRGIIVQCDAAVAQIRSDGW